MTEPVKCCGTCGNCEQCNGHTPESIPIDPAEYMAMNIDCCCWEPHP